MKTKFILTFLIFCSLVFQAQNNNDAEIKISDLVVPTAPGFTLLDEAPTAIDRPGTARAFGLNVLNSIVQNNGIPTNYAVEFTPYWFFKHRNLTTSRYYGWDEAAGKRIWASPSRTSVSFSYSQKENEIGEKVNHLAIGVRIPLARVFKESYYTHDLDTFIVEINRRMSALSTDINGQINLRQAQIQGRIRSLESNPYVSPEIIQLKIDRRDVQAKIDSFELNTTMLPQIIEWKKDVRNIDNSIQGYLENWSFDLDRKSEIELLKKQFDSLEIVRIQNQNALNEDALTKSLVDSFKLKLTQKPLYSLDFAAAATCAFNNKDIKSTSFGKGGIWLTHEIAIPMAANKKSYFNMLACHRLIVDNTALDSDGKLSTQATFDNGVKLEFEIYRFSFSGEALYRVNLMDSDKNSYRANGLLKYLIKDGLYFCGSFGRNFGDTNNIISAFGINWGFRSGNESSTQTLGNVNN